MTETRFPYQDAFLPAEQRVADLLSRMTVEDKAGLMFQPMAPFGTDLDEPGVFGSPSMRKILDRRITHVNILQAATARELAQWHNSVQRMALETELGIPFTISSDPRHSFSDNPATALTSGPFSQWPEFLGFGALGDAELTERFADTVRREYLAVGIRLALHPQVDLATEPRWARASGTFGSSAEVAGRLGAAYTRGLQGAELGPDSVAAMAKHFPGGGPQLDGEDAHFDYGREQVYPGGQFELHLQPFRELIAAGVSQIMPYYGMPVGTEYEEVGFGFNQQIVTGLLRDRLGFDGIVCTDWGILSRTFWGVEHLSYSERMLKSLDAGVDQFGGEFQPQVLVDLVRGGAVAESRLDVSARRLLREKFRLGLFDDRRFVDADAADTIVGAPRARAEGLAAQAAAVTLLVNQDGPAHLPLAGEPKLYLEGMSPDAVAGWADIVATPAEADVALVRIDAPFDKRGKQGDIEYHFRAGSLEFHQDELAHLRQIADQVPLVVDVYLDRPAILAPVAELAAVITANYGASDEACAQVMFGAAEPKGRLPFEIPSSMAAVEKNLADVPDDTKDPTFHVGHGLRYTDWSPATAPRAVATRSVEVAAPTGRYDLATAALADLLDDPEALAVLDELVPELSAHPMIGQVRRMSAETVLQLIAADAPAQLLTEVRSRLSALQP